MPVGAPHYLDRRLTLVLILSCMSALLPWTEPWLLHLWQARSCFARWFPQIHLSMGGALCDDSAVKGGLVTGTKQAHIYQLELLATFLALKYFCLVFTGHYVLVSKVKTSVVSNIKRQERDLLTSPAEDFSFSVAVLQCWFSATRAGQCSLKVIFPYFKKICNNNMYKAKRKKGFVCYFSRQQHWLRQKKWRKKKTICSLKERNKVQHHVALLHSWAWWRAAVNWEENCADSCLYVQETLHKCHHRLPHFTAWIEGLQQSHMRAWYPILHDVPHCSSSGIRSCSNNYSL